MMATATATMPLPFKDDENSSEHDVGMSLSPAPSPHTTLTPLEAAQLSAQARGGVNRIDDVESSSPPPDDGEGESTVRLPHPVADNDRFLSPTCSLSMSGVVSQNGMDDIETNLIQTTEEPSSSDEQLEKRILHLEQSLASLTELCKGLINQQQESRQRSPSSSPPHRRFDTETEILSQWPPAQQPLLDSPEVSTRRRRRRSAKDDKHQPKPPKTMSMLLLDISAGESRGPSMIPFTEDLNEASGDSGGERGNSSSSNSEVNLGRDLKELGATPMLNGGDITGGIATPIQDSSAITTPGSSSNESSPREQLTRLHSSLKIVATQESNLECQAYTSTHLEALRLRHEAGKARAYSFNDTLAKTPEVKYRKQLEKRSASKVENKMPSIPSPVPDTPIFDVLKTTDNDVTESVETFVQVLSPDLTSNMNRLDVPILSSARIGDDEVKKPLSVIPRKDSTTSNFSTKNKELFEQQPNEPSEGKARIGADVILTKESSCSTVSEKKNTVASSGDATVNNRVRSRSTISEKDDVVSTTSTALTVKSNNTIKLSEKNTKQEIPNDAKNKKTMKEYIINDLLNIDSRHEDGSATEDIDANMEEFLRIPFKLENLMWFALAVCTDSFLYVWTLLPLRAIWGCVCLLCTILRPKKGIKGIMFHRRHLYVLIQCLLVWFVFYHVLHPISIGKLYHWIRGQAMLKLYVLIAIVEVFDRLLCSFGQDAWDSLYWNTRRRPWHPRMVVSMIVVGVYVTIHSLFLFVHVATLSVAVNSADNALLTLLISGNFAEIKSTVFKKYNKQNLFKITTSDICERFKLALFLLLILLLNCFQGEVSRSMVKEYYTMCLIVMVAELISDWIKHSFITKFNFIKSTAYFDYALILSGDVTGIGHEDLNLDYTHAAVKRIGLAQIPLVCVTARYLHEALRFTIAFRGNGDVEHPMRALAELFDIPLWKFYSGLFVLMVAFVGLKIGLGVVIRLIARNNLGGDVIEMLERKSSRPPTPQHSIPKEINRKVSTEGKKNQ